ncbi:hypothetical protein [Yoonia sp.]|uniref:hypothetical protein n=1 Tax=Yoonia sp. TaxID=2212373 RepID=UPI0025DB461C|nr:hypothetical protein [Yoonia sp.]
MNLLTASAVCIGLVVGGSAWGQTDEPVTIDRVQGELADAYQATGQYTPQERDEALAAISASLDQIDVQIERLELRARTLA